MFELRSRKSKILMQLLLLLMTIPYVLPLVQMVLGSLGGRGLYNYKAVWDTGVVPTYFRNSAIIAFGVILLVYFFSMTAGFGFAKLYIRKKEVYFWLILLAMTLPEVIPPCLSPSRSCICSTPFSRSFCPPLPCRFPSPPCWCGTLTKAFPAS